MHVADAHILKCIFRCMLSDVSKAHSPKRVSLPGEGPLQLFHEHSGARAVAACRSNGDDGVPGICSSAQSGRAGIGK